MRLLASVAMRLWLCCLVSAGMAGLCWPWAPVTDGVTAFVSLSEVCVITGESVPMLAVHGGPCTAVGLALSPLPVVARVLGVEISCKCQEPVRKLQSRFLHPGQVWALEFVCRGRRQSKDSPGNTGLAERGTAHGLSGRGILPGPRGPERRFWGKGKCLELIPATCPGCAGGAALWRLSPGGLALRPCTGVACPLGGARMAASRRRPWVGPPGSSQAVINALG